MTPDKVLPHIQEHGRVIETSLSAEIEAPLAAALAAASHPTRLDRRGANARQPRQVQTSARHKKTIGAPGSTPAEDHLLGRMREGGLGAPLGVTIATSR
jgi:hypothetical protein